MPVTPTLPCPCGTGLDYDSCCGPVVRNETPAVSPEALMRSRYTAYVRHDVDHLFRTWHPRTRPTDVAPDQDLDWTGLEVLDVADTGPGSGEVEFRAHWTWSGRQGTLHERSRFEQRAGRWVYVDGDER